jgi:hypothetical protein
LAKLLEPQAHEVSTPGASEGRCFISIFRRWEECKALAQIKGETCVSLYLPTSPLGRKVKLKRTAFLVKEARAQLKDGGVDKTKIAAFEEQLDRLAGGDRALLRVEAATGDRGRVRLSSSWSTSMQLVPGFVSDPDGSVTYSTADDAETYSVVDEVARRALSTGARVMGAKHELPDRAALTAILRYEFHCRPATVRCHS